MSPPQLDQLVSRIALYPDALLAQILAAATFPDQIPDADMWAKQHKYLHGDELARAVADDHLPWDPSVQALLPFPAILHMMNSDPGWTQQLGDAFLSQRNDVMDAVQRMRQHAYDYGYLRTNSQLSVVVSGPRYIVINPVNPVLYYVPVYDPVVVFAPPRPGFVISGAIRFGAGFSLGAAFAPWGWGGARFGWTEHTVVINNHPWSRTYVNRGTYVHPYEKVPHYEPSKRVENHRVEEHHDEHRQPPPKHESGRGDERERRK
jgi:Protein of unknown function (DUF3300)